MEFDYIIVGAGSSGCVLADRLSADGRSRVLLLEAGGHNESELVNTPRLFMKMFGNPTYFWQFPLEPRPRRPSEAWHYGRGLGGSSSTNGTWYMRGLPADYDGWAAQGLTDWGWPEVARSYAAMESYCDPHADPSRGRYGPLQVTQLPFRSPFLDAVVAAAGQLGLPYLADINTPGRDGIGYTQATVDRRGRRASAYRAFLKPAMKRPNLTVITDALVHRVDINESRAQGVVYEKGGQLVSAVAHDEVILSAGALQSPKLLQLSGIGPREVLQAAGVPVIMELPHVGCNLADHAAVSLSFRLKNYAGFNREFSGWRLGRNIIRYLLTRSGLMAYTSPELTAMMRLEETTDRPDVQIGIGLFSMRSTAEMKADPGQGALERSPGFTLNAMYLQPKSRGRVAIRSDRIGDAVALEHDSLRHSDDRRALIKMVRMMRKLASQPALSHFSEGEVNPGPQVRSDEDIEETLSWLVSPGLHATGTCRMGQLGTSVVDGRCRVHGIKGLRVVDCSAMPTPPSGNTNGPAMMFGWRAAEFILAERAAI